MALVWLGLVLLLLCGTDSSIDRTPRTLWISIHYLFLLLLPREGNFDPLKRVRHLIIESPVVNPNHESI